MKIAKIGRGKSPKKSMGGDWKLSDYICPNCHHQLFCSYEFDPGVGSCGGSAMNLACSMCGYSRKDI